MTQVERATTVPSAFVWLLATALVLGACDQPNVTAAPTSGPTSGPAGTAGAAATDGLQPASSGQPGGGPVGLLLTEVRFAPKAGEPGFAEIANHGSTAAEIAGLRLVIHGAQLPLAGFTQPLAPGAVVLVILDGGNKTEASVLHAPAGVTLGADDGIDLLDATGSLVDRVEWGEGHPFGVSLSAGGFNGGVEPGMTIGRSPSAVLPNQPLEWLVFASSDASPGLPNPVPGVGVLLPLPGTVVDGSGATLAWYPLVGATEYRIQVATDPAFSTTVLDSRTAESQVETGALASGEYFWRIAAVEASGTASTFSPASTFEVIATGLGLRSARTRSRSAIDNAAPQLNVALLSQRKDTAMLLLERNVETGAHPWDADHGTLDPRDPSDNKNCAIASVAMVNHFFGGDLSQDRIAYEIFKGRAPGPELDMLFGGGTSELQVSDAMAFALGAASVHVGTGHSPDEIWAAVTTSIDSGRPVVAAGLHHTFVFTGYSAVAGKRLLALNDPWNYAGRSGTGAYNIDANSGASAAVLDLWIPPAGAVGRRQEPSVRTDGDGDGMVDFDETERFQTNPADRDSDHDKLPDKQDVLSGIFDATYGYARQPEPEGQGRDYDLDGIPTERDSDSDGGGCSDGFEDTSFDGHKNGTESWNFDTQDDRCNGWQGTMTATHTWDQSGHIGTSTTTFSGLWTLDPLGDAGCRPDAPDGCLLYRPTGSISWTWDAEEANPSTLEPGWCKESRSGTDEAGTGRPDQQVFYLRVVDSEHYGYSGGANYQPSDGASRKCTDLHGFTNLSGFFALDPDSSSENKVSDNECYSVTWQIDLDGETIKGSCYEYRYTYNSLLYSWNLRRVGNATPGS